jgi:AcrR family transcriptional regulator
MAKNYHHGDLREALIAETLNMIQNDEVPLIGFRELARRLDVSRTAPYRHFESVEHLLAVVAEEGYRKFLESLESVSRTAHLSNKERFRDLGIAYIHFALENASHYRLMFEPRFFQDGRFIEVKQLSSKAFDLLKQTAASCLPPDSTEEEKKHLAQLAWAFVHGISRLFIDGQWSRKRNRQKFIRDSCEKILDLL